MGRGSKKNVRLSGRKFGIKKRGKIQEKYFADVAIISPKKIQDLATADNPYQYSSGIEYLLVNGKLAIKKGSYTGVRNGEVIKK